MGRSPGYKPLILRRCHSCGLPQLYEAFKGLNSVCGPAYNLKGIKGKFSAFLLFHCSSFHGMMGADPAVAGGGDSIINKYIINRPPV